MGPEVVKTLSSLDSMERSNMQRKKQEATVSMKEGKTLDRERIVEALRTRSCRVRSFKKEGEEEKKEEEGRREEGR